MVLDDLLEELDLLYIDSLEKELGQPDRQYVLDKMAEIAASCSSWLSECKNLTADLRIRFERIKKMAEATIDETKKGYDVLLHWTAMRADMLDQLAELNKGRKAA